jgi:triacylglycerol lipase
MIPRKVPETAGGARAGASKRGEDFASYPVLLVPGWGAPLWHTRWIAKHLERAGLTVEQMSLPFMSTGDMVESAEAVDARVDEIIEDTGAEKVNMVGYSLGGLIVRIWLQGFDGQERLGRAVFVGSPQDGIYTGYAAAFTKAGRQVSKGSRFMRDLNREGPCGCGDGRCLSIYLWKDGTILPAKSARLFCGYNLELVWPVMHWGLVFNREVIGAVADFLAGGFPEGAVPGGGCQAEV